MINIWYDLVFGWKRDMSYVPSQLWWSKFTTRNFCDRLEPPQRFTKRDEQMPLKLKAYILQKVIPQVFSLHLQMFPSNSCFIAVALVSLWRLTREFSVRWILIASLATMPWTSCRMDNRCWDDSHWWHSPTIKTSYWVAISPPPSHQHFYNIFPGDINTIPSYGWFMALCCPHYL